MIFRNCVKACDSITADGQDAAIEAAAMANLAAFDLEALKPLQLLALRDLVRGIDVYACFPTGFGKSMITSISYHLCAVTWQQAALHDFHLIPSSSLCFR